MGLDMAQQAIEAHESRELVMKMGTYKAKPNVSHRLNWKIVSWPKDCSTTEWLNMGGMIYSVSSMQA